MLHTKTTWFETVVWLQSLLVMGLGCSIIALMLVLLIAVPSMETDLDARRSVFIFVVSLPALLVVVHRAYWRRSYRCSQILIVLYAVAGTGALVSAVYDILTTAMWLISEGDYTTNQQFFSLRRLLLEAGPALYVTWSSYPQWRWARKLRDAHINGEAAP